MSYLKILLLAALASVSVLSIGQYLQTSHTLPPTETAHSKAIEWHKVSDILDLQKKQRKLIIIDVYTDWCKWCTVMDEKTFKDPYLSQYLNERFHLVKFNAEQREPVTFRGQKHSYVPSGRRGYHTLAADLLQGSLSYPSFVVLDQDLNALKVIKGYKDAIAFQEELNTIAP